MLPVEIPLDVSLAWTIAPARTGDSGESLPAKHTDITI